MKLQKFANFLIATSIGFHLAFLNNSFAAEIRGSITSLSGLPLDSLNLQLWRLNTETGLVEFYDSKAPENGEYVFTDIPLGSYKLNCQDFSGVHAFQYHDGSSVLNNASLIQLDSENSILVKNFSLQEGAEIGGKITGPPLNPAPLQIMLSILKTSDVDGSIEYVCGLGSDVHGLWRLGLLPGKYKVILKDDVTNLSKESYWAFQVYQNSLSEESGSVIQISNKDESYTDIDAIMQKAKVISGIVKDSEGNPVDGIYADLAIFNPTAKAWESSLAVKTREGGKYALHVGSGTYRLSFFDDSQKYEVEYWNDKRTENDASELIISDNSIEISPVLDIRGDNFQGIKTLQDLSYQNTLSKQAFIDSDFLDFSHLKDSDESQLMPFDNATFTANSSTGLELVSHTPYMAQGVKTFNKSLPVTSDWQIDVKAHISNFSTQLPNPYYYATIMIGKLGSDFSSSAANRVTLSMTRSKQTSSTVSNEYFKNTINSGIWINNASALGDPPVWQAAEEDVFLRIKYFSSNKSCYLYSSRSASQYELVKSYSLGDIWSLDPGNSIYFAFNAGSEPFQTLSEYNENSNKDFYLAPGQLYFSDFKISPLVTEISIGPDVDDASGSGVASAPSSGGGGPAQVQKSKKGGKGKSSAKKSSSGSSKKSAASKSSGGKKSGGKKKKK